MPYPSSPDVNDRRVEFVHVEQIGKIEAYVLSSVVPIRMALEHLPEGRDVQERVPARQGFDCLIFRAALEGDALRLQQLDLLLRCQHGLEVPRLVHALVYAPRDVCRVCILHMAILPFVVSLFYHAPPHLPLCRVRVSLVWSLPSLRKML